MTDVAALLGVSRMTLYRRMREYELTGQRDWDDISDEELDERVSGVLAQHADWGERMVIGALKGSGVSLPRWRVRESIGRVDPISRQLRWSQAIRRRPYSVPCPNALWHIDSYMKLVRWGFTVHGGIDGFSRLVVYLACNEDNRAVTVSSLFLDACTAYGMPSRVRADYGGENNEVEKIMNDHRGEGRGSMLRGSSIHNQRIERLWRDVFTCVVRLYYRLFYFLEHHGLLHLDSPVDLYALHYVFLPRIRQSLKQFVNAWNHHSIRTARGKSPHQLFVAGCLADTHGTHGENTATAFPVVDDPSLLAGYYGIDWNGPQPAERADVACPQVPFLQLAPDQFEILQENVDPCADDNNHGVDSYLEVQQLLCELDD